MGPLDVVVIGAGYAGLTCAHQLSKRKLSIALLEASGRPGGRTLDKLVEGQMRLELGGQYIAPAQERISSLVAEFGLATFPAWGAGDHFLVLETRTGRYQASPVAALSEKMGEPRAIQQEIESAIRQLEALYAQVDAAQPWKAARSEEWDSYTFQTWLDKTLQSPLAKQFFRLMANQGFSTEPEQISLLQMLWFFKTSHGIPRWAIGGPQANRIEGGSQLLAEKMAERLRDKILYDHPVRGVEQLENEVRVHTAAETFKAQSVVVCVPPQLINTIAFNPPLPPDTFRAFSSMQTGNAMKVQAVYKTPFWREKGFSGNGISFSRIPAFTYDNSGADGTPGVLLGFLSAKRATAWNDKPKAERKNAVLNTWAAVFGDEALHPLEYIEQDWMEEPFIRGGHGCHFPPGVWGELGAALGGIRLPHHDRVLFAASDLAKDWNGYLEGAVYAGEQAAREVVDILSGRHHRAGIY